MGQATSLWMQFCDSTSEKVDYADYCSVNMESI